MKKIGICGVYVGERGFPGGQPEKVGAIVRELFRYYGAKEVQIANTLNWKRNPLKLLIDCIKLSINCTNIIILPAHNGLKILTILFLGLNTIFHRKIHYIVIGGWLPDYLTKDDILRNRIKDFVGIYVETETIKIELEKLGLSNVSIMNNFKNLRPLPIEELRNDYVEPYRLCVFSRIVKEKGIEDAIQAVVQVNKTLSREIFHLDLYGFIHQHYKVDFQKIINQSPDYVRYCGSVNPSQAVETLKSYFLQLFPTRYKTEGIPGSIIDSFFAGVPVLASRWNSFNDIIEEGKTGLGFHFQDLEDFKSMLLYIADNPSVIINMKKLCIAKSYNYSPDFVMNEFIMNSLEE